MGYRKFGTCFFERYAQHTLENLLGERYSNLVNRDRPDLQLEDQSLGIEVTRAMEPNRQNANRLLKELAGMEVKNGTGDDLQKIVEHGYAYGLPGLNYTGAIEEQYWNLALPLQRILASKIEKVARGFYGNFEEFGLYVFCRDLLDLTQVDAALTYTLALQDNLDIRYNKLYLSQTDTLYVCDLADDHFYNGMESRISIYPVPDILRRELFFKSLGY